MIKVRPKESRNQRRGNLLKSDERKHMVTRFRLPYTAKQVYAMLYEACRVEVAHRHGEFNATEQYKSTFGTFPIGLHRSLHFRIVPLRRCRKWETTILRALQNLINYLRSDGGITAMRMHIRYAAT